MSNPHLTSPSSLQNPFASSSSLALRSRALAVDKIHHHLLPSTTTTSLLRPIIIRCCSYSSSSYSQVKRGTVDFERRRAPIRRELYRRVSRSEDPEAGPVSVIERWQSEHNRKLTKWETLRVAKKLRKFHLHKRALAVFEWMAARDEQFTFNSSDAAILLDLISKVRGVSSAEEYFEGLSRALRDKRTYCALLNAYANAKMKDEAEAVLETMRNKGYITDPLPYNVIMAMYKDLQEHEKVISIIKEMREMNMQLDKYSFNTWITTCAAMEDAEEMEQVLEVLETDHTMSADWSTYCTLATMHIRLGKIEKAEKYIKEAESRLPRKVRTSFNYILGLYSLVGKKDEVYRIWQLYKSSFHKMLNSGYQAMLSALVKLDDIEGAESIYQEWLSYTTRFDAKVCNILLSYYGKHGQATKAEHCLEEMLDQGEALKPISCEIVAEAYMEEKETSKALFYLKRAVVSMGNISANWRPKPKTIAKFLVLCGEKSNKASVESLVELLREVKCLDDVRYKSLISAHAEAEVEG